MNLDEGITNDRSFQKIVITYIALSDLRTMKGDQYSSIVMTTHHTTLDMGDISPSFIFT